ncbi:hypothetical protein EV360DRAFT_48359 [Lentinula raphanica]|nr:hypothetical protein EV360DRAFT_48359 [Lentinula raphanica]
MDSKSSPVLEHLRVSQLDSQDEPQHSSVEQGIFFANSHEFDIHGGSFNHANRDMHHTVNNDNSSKSDFNNNYSGSITRYNGGHNDYRGATNNDGSNHTNHAYSTAWDNQHIGVQNSSFHYYTALLSNMVIAQGNNSSRRAASGPALNDQHSKYAGPQNLPHSMPQPEPQLLNNDNKIEPANAYLPRSDLQEELANLSLESTGIQHQPYESRSSHSTRVGSGTQAPAYHSQEAEKPGVVQLRQCVQVYLADLPETEKGNMSGLADALVIAGWDRRSMADSSWDDLKSFSYNGSWAPLVFIPLRKICKGE